MTDSKDQNERMAILETNTANIEKLVIRMDGKLDGIITKNVTKEELAKELEWRDKEIADMKEGQRWLRRMLATAVVGGIVSLAGAIALFFMLGGKGK